MNLFLFNWVNKLPNNYLETKKPKKVALESVDRIIENVEIVNCDVLVHFPICWNKSQSDSFK